LPPTSSLTGTSKSPDQPPKVPHERHELCFTPATEMARRIAARELSPVELVDAVLARAETLEPQLNMFALPMFDTARQAAREAEKAVMTGGALGRCNGVPITVKDNVGIGGLRIANGSAAFMDTIAPADAAVVARAKAPAPSSSARPTCPNSPTRF